MRTDVAPLIRLEDYRPPDYLITAVHLDIVLDPVETHVRSLLTIEPNRAGKAGAPLVLDGDDLSLVGIALNGATLPETAYEAKPSSLTLWKPPGKPFTLQIETRINPSANTKLMGLYRSNGVYCTQCEADGFRRITYFLDRPDVLSIYTVRLEGDIGETPLLLSNGNRLTAG